MRSNPHAKKTGQIFLATILLGLVFLVQINSAEARNWASTTLEIRQSCGDGVMDFGEECDGNDFSIGSDFGTSSCTVLVASSTVSPDLFNRGTVSCTPASSTDPDFGCKLDRRDCSLCGNGISEGSEECDGTTFQNPYHYTYPYDSIIDVCKATTTDRYTRKYGYTGTDEAHCFCILNGFPMEPGRAVCSSNCTAQINVGTNCLYSTTTTVGNEGSQGGGTGGGSSGGGSSGGGFNPNYVPGSETPPKDTKLVISGKASPGAQIKILKDGALWVTVSADINADYKFESDNDKYKITPGVVTIGVIATDSKGQASAMFSTTFRVASGAVTTITGANIAPTINLSKTTISRGEKMQVFGLTVPVGLIKVSFIGKKETIETANSNSKGEWTLDYDTKNLDNDTTYLVKALFEAFTGSTSAKSGYSKALSLQVGKGGGAPDSACPGADLNKDSKVNLVDFSILLYNWGGNNACSDQNRNGKVDLTDFSIMLFNWTG